MKHTTKGDNGSSMILLALTAISGTTPIVVQDSMVQFDGVAYVLKSTGTVAGAWTIQAANNYQAPGAGGLRNTPANAGDFGDVSSLCTPALAAAAGAPKTQAVQIVPFGWGAAQVTFTPTSGAGNVAVYRVAKGNS